MGPEVSNKGAAIAKLMIPKSLSNKANITSVGELLTYYQYLNYK